MWALNSIYIPSFCSAALNSEEVVDEQPCQVVASPTPSPLAHQGSILHDAFVTIGQSPHQLMAFLLPTPPKLEIEPPASLSFDPHNYTLQEPAKEMEEEPHNPLASSLQAREESVCADPSAGSSFSSACDLTRSLEPWTFSVDDHLTWAGSSQSQITFLNSFFP